MKYLIKRLYSWNKRKKFDEVEKIRPYKRIRSRKLVITVKIGKEENYLGKILERSEEKKSPNSF